MYFTVYPLLTFSLTLCICKQGRGAAGTPPTHRPNQTLSLCIVYLNNYLCQPAGNINPTAMVPMLLELPRYPTSYHLDLHPSPNPASIRLHASRYQRADTRVVRVRLHLVACLLSPETAHARCRWAPPWNLQTSGFWMEVVVPGVLRDCPVM